MTTIDQSVDFATATGGGGHWKSLGTPAQAKGQYVEGDIYRLWSKFGLFQFRAGYDNYTIILYNRSDSAPDSGVFFYPESRSFGTQNAYLWEGLKGNYSNTDPADDPLDRIEHWVPDA